MSSWKNFVESFKNADLMGKHQEAQEIMETGDLSKARLFLLEELEKKPKSQSLLSTMAGLLEDQGEYDQALEYYDRCLSVDNDDATIYNKARILIQELDEFEDGLKTIKSFRGDNELEQGIEELKADALLHLEKFEECEKICKKIMKEDPEALDCIQIYADCCYEQENYQKSLDLTEKILELDSTDIDAQNNKADLLIRLEKYDEALKICDDLLSQDSSDEMALANKGEIFIQKSQFKEAVILLQNCVLINPTYDEAWILLAKAQTHQNLIDDALDSLLVATSLEPELLDKLECIKSEKIRKHERFQRLISKQSEK